MNIPACNHTHLVCHGFSWAGSPGPGQLRAPRAWNQTRRPADLHPIKHSSRAWGLLSSPKLSAAPIPRGCKAEVSGLWLGTGWGPLWSQLPASAPLFTVLHIHSSGHACQLLEGHHEELSQFESLWPLPSLPWGLSFKELTQLGHHRVI